MYLNHILELTQIVDAEKFTKIFGLASNQSECVDENKYIDRTLASKGIIVAYHDKQYKKKIQLTVNPNVILDGDEPDKNNASKVSRKLEKRIADYFESKHELDDFTLQGLALTTDIDVGSREKVSDYLKVLQRVGRVKGFSPSNDKRVDSDISFCLEGNSNGIDFFIYDLEAHLRRQENGRKQLKPIIEKSKGILRVEVHLTESKAVRAYTDETITSDQITALLEKAQKIFLETFMRIIPFGAFFKKDKAVEITRKEVTDAALRRRMLRLLNLIPEKKSLLLAQKALNYRKIDDVMDEFAAIDLAPVTLSKRHDVKQLKNLYSYI